VAQDWRSVIQNPGSVDIHKRPSLIISIEGEEKAGKTHLSLTAPKPLAILGTDFGTDRPMGKFQGEKILPKEYPYSVPAGLGPDKIAELTLPVWTQFREDHLALVHSGLYRTIVWDTGGELYELQRLAYHGKLASIPELAYGQLKGEYKELVRACKIAGMSLIVIHQMKNEYKRQPGQSRGEATGKRIRSGVEAIGYMVDSYVRLDYTPPQKPKHVKDPGSDQVWRTTILRCGHNPSVNGTEWENLTFPELASILKPEVDSDLWEMKA
jgi:hypothetical protein